MALKFKTPKPTPKVQQVQQGPAMPPDQLLKRHTSYQPVQGTIPGLNYGLPFGGLPQATYAAPIVRRVPAPPIPIPGADLNHAINYYADYGGCGFWRMCWPEHFLNAYQRAIVNGLTTMILEPRFYTGVKAVKLQRQATPIQYEFIKFLKMAAQEYGFKIIYEIDDIVFREDIPKYNRCRDAFDDPEIVKSILSMMREVDEISVTCEYMKDYYKEKTGNQNVTIIPNFPPRTWLDRFYDADKLTDNFIKNQKQPRVGWLVSGTHFDIVNKTGFKDDGSHVVDHMIKTRKKYKWVFLGSHPLQLKPFIDSGEMEFHDWSILYDYPSKIASLNLNAVVAPLLDNVFNKSKSEIKYLEAGALGIPGVFQDLVTYKNADLRFKTGDEMIDQLNTLLTDINTYNKYSGKARKYAESMWLEDHLDEHFELYFTKPEERVALTKWNP